MGNSYSSTGAAYIRVSTEDQTEFSPDSQRKKIQEYADLHHIQIPESYVFVDEGISGRCADNRPAFLHMIGLAKQTPRPFDQILVWKFSRFARSRQDSIFYKSMLRRECGIDVISITEQLSDDPTSILIEALLEAMDEYYSINLAQEVRRGMNEKFSRGGIVGPPPFGYLPGKERYETDPHNALFIPMIFSDFLQGMSYRQIAEKLNRMGARTIRGNFFEARTVKYILGNPVYLGRQRRHPSPSADAFVTAAAFHEPLISEDIFQEVQERIHLLSHNCQTHSSQTAVSFMLKGLVRCSHCGATLTRTGKGEGLQCCKYARGQCPESHSITLPRLNSAVFRQLSLDFPPAMKLTLTDGCPEKAAKKGRNQIPAPNILLTFSELLQLLEKPLLSSRTKNQILHTLISRIIFSRKEGTIQIYYRR
ncbi:MAG: recombinase family protein [Clostridiales bacterium]|nr:recombinase family protein [Clostridiales bacterium]